MVINCKNLKHILDLLKMVQITKPNIPFLIDNFNQMEISNKDTISLTQVNNVATNKQTQLSHMFLILGAIRHKKVLLILHLANQMFAKFLHHTLECMVVVMICHQLSKLLANFSNLLAFSSSF